MDLKIVESLGCGQVALHGKPADLPVNAANPLQITKDRLIPAYPCAFAVESNQPAS